MGKIIDGKQISNDVKAKIAEETAQLKEQGVEVGLAVVIVGEDPASKVYVRNKRLACEKVGFNSYEYALGEDTTEEQLLELVDKLNNDPKVNGILVQLPLPEHLNDKTIINNIRADKDVDAFHPINVGKIMIGEYSFLPCTPAGVMELIHSTGIEVSGKECVVVGRSNIVGKPMSMLLLHESGTVTMCHSKTKDLKAVCRRADILVSAVGRAKMITSEYVKDGAVIIDVGMNRDENGKLCGDVDFDDCKDKASYITPVPGGVGPMTIAMLMRNTLTAAKQQNGIL
ncbi:MAG: bifunctional methylenetetrahydrofolate dehydrogenase/methenyltetrahydrofolate cyclohydrolase FolD [Ruminococcus sp.]|nr:bifunctional methylenetetrahydrofolate dehydrogenase/methenyltetrahydrofolate cyclohydrolase FolD [Ruminococcus sp.]